MTVPAATQRVAPGRPPPVPGPRRPGGRRFGPLGMQDRRQRWVIAIGLALAVLIGALAMFSTRTVVLALVAGTVLAAVCRRPALAAYVVIGVTPLVAGIDRGLLIPVLRPNEAVAALVGAGLVLAWLPKLVAEGFPRIRLGRVELSLLLMALASSVLPLLWLGVRNRDITQDDILYSLTLWKFCGVFLLVRAAVRSEPEVRRCLVVGMVAAAIVAIIAILQSLKLFGVPGMLRTYYTHFGNTRALEINRGSSTLSLPVAVADLMVFNIAIAWGWLRRHGRHQPLLYGAIALFVMGALASGQISAGIALALAGFVIILLAGDLRPLITALPIMVAGYLTLRPVIDRRLQGFSSPAGLPESWVGRLRNLNTYFFPELFSNFHFVLGVRPSARILISQRRGYVWIESGYTWLLWAGGIPLLLSFFYFVWTCAKVTWRRACSRVDAVGTAATGSFVSLVVVAVLMLFDPHLSYRGSGDMFFALLALATLRLAPAGSSPTDRPAPAVRRRVNA